MGRLVTVIRRKLTPSEAKNTILELEQWFRVHPRRRICHTDWFKVDKRTIREDVLAHTEGGTNG